MHFQHGTFICPRCKSQDKDAHFIALAEYRLLCGETITNQAFREWCGVKDRYASNRLLKALPKIGHTKERFMKFRSRFLLCIGTLYTKRT